MDLRRSLAGSSILTASLMLVLAPPSRATWPRDPVVGAVPICTAANDQLVPKVASDGAGGAILVWQDHRAGADGIYVQRLSGSGARLWGANGVALCTAANQQLAPAIIPDGAGGAIVVWYDNRTLGGTNYDIYAQRVNASGAAQWTPDGVPICTFSGGQYYPFLVSDGAGGAIVTWEDRRNPNHDVYVQRINGAGATQWTTNGVVLCNLSGNQSFPKIAADGAGGAIVAWQDFRNGIHLDIFAQRVNGAGTAQWTGNGVQLCTAGASQALPAIVADGAGGAIVAWEDSRSGISTDLYAQRVNGTGATQWAPDGVEVTIAGSEQTAVAITSDGAGGAILAWHDVRSGVTYDIYVQRMSAAGAAMWTTNGVPLCTTASVQLNPAIVGDGVGGAIVTWEDLTTDPHYDILARRITAAGAPQWAATGVAVSTATLAQRSPALGTDGAGGAIIAWNDLRNGAHQDIAAQRIDQWGQLSAAPVIANVTDVPNDEGGRVKVSWHSSALDSFPAFSIGSYRIYRSVPPKFAAQSVRTGAPLVAFPDRPSAGGLLVRRGEGIATSFWELVGTVTATHLPGYSFLAATTSDSTASSNPMTYFMVEALLTGGTQWWFSDPDSGYSVDNLSPAPPGPFVAQYFPGSSPAAALPAKRVGRGAEVAMSYTWLHWPPSTEADLLEYRVHRGPTADFVPGPGNLVVAQPDTGYQDHGAPPSYYKLIAVDIHGNQSTATTTLPENLTEVPPGRSMTRAWLAAAAPNPMSSDTEIRYGLTAEGHVRLDLFDAAGRRVRTLVEGSRTAGEHVAHWDGRLLDGKPAAGGIYWIRLVAGGRVLSGHIVALGR